MFLIQYLMIFSILWLVIVGQDVNYDLTKVTPIQLAAVGRVANLGELYDARSDQFLHLSILKSALPVSSIISTHNRQTKLKYTFANTMEEKFSLMDISAGLSLSILGGLFKLEGSGKFFKDTKKSGKSAKASLINSISTEYEQISITDTSIQPLINLDALEQIDATHAVVGIQWGGSVFLSVEDPNEANADQQKVQGSLKTELNLLASTISGKAVANVNQQKRDKFSKFNFEIYGDILPDEVPQNVIDALKFMKNVSKFLQSANNGKGKAMKYTLIPINLLIESKINSVLNNIDESTVKMCVKLFDNMNRVEQKLNDLVNYVQKYEKHILTSKVDVLKAIQFNYEIYQSKVQKNLSEHLILVRSGNESALVLQEVMLNAAKHQYSWQNVKMQDFSKINEEIAFLQLMSSLNVTLLNKEKSLQIFLSEHYDNDIYLLFYNDEFPKTVEKSLSTFQDMVHQSKSNKTLFAAVKNELFGFNNTSKLSFYRKGRLEVDDLSDTTMIPDIKNRETWTVEFMKSLLAHLLFDSETLKNEINVLINENEDKSLELEKQKNQIKSLESQLKLQLGQQNQTLVGLLNSQTDEINSMKTNFEKQLNSIIPMKSKISSIETSLIPIGFLYTQLPNTSAPNELWPQFKWQDVTLDYSGLFFRAEGGESLPFGQIQQQNQSWISQVHLYGGWYDSWNPKGDWSGGNYLGYTTSLNQGKWIETNPGSNLAIGSLVFYTTSGEVRPKNIAIKIFKRIK